MHIASMNWQLLSNVYNMALNFGLFVFMSRFLSVEDFALYAVGVLICHYVWTVAQSGFTSLAYSVGYRNQRLASALMISNILISAPICVVSAVLILAWFNDTSGIFLALLAITVFFASLSDVVNVSLLREMRFREVALKMIFVQSVSACGAVVAAVLGWGVWSLFFQRVIAIILDTALIYWLATWRPSPRMAPRAAGVVMRAAGAFSLQALISAFDQRMGEFATGFASSLVGLATFRIATRITETAQVATVQPITSVATPAIATSTTRTHTLRYFHLAYLWVGALPFAGLVFFGDIAVSIVFGERWVSAGPILQMIAIGFFAAGPTALLEIMLVAIGRPVTLLWIRVGSLAVGAVVAVALVQYGVEYIGLLLAIKTIILTPFLLRVYSKHGGLSPLESITIIIAPFLVSLIPVGAARFVYEYTKGPGLDWVALIASVLPFAILYLGLAYMFGWKQIRAAMRAPTSRLARDPRRMRTNEVVDAA